jgi:hypothetical protein
VRSFPFSSAVAPWPKSALTVNRKLYDLNTVPLLDFLLPLELAELDPLALIPSWWDSSSSTSDSFSISYIEGIEDSSEEDIFLNSDVSEGR